MHLCLPILCEGAVLKKIVVGGSLKIDFHIWKSLSLQGLCKTLYYGHCLHSQPLWVPLWAISECEECDF